MRRALLYALIAALAGCATVNVQTDYDPARRSQLAAYHTYAWEDRPVRNDARVNNPIVRDEVRAAVERSLLSRGLVPAPAGSEPDVFVSWAAAIHSHLAIDAVPGYYGYGVGSWWGPGFAVTAPVGTVQEYQDGTLVIDLVDAKSNELVWRGLAEAELDPGESAVDRANRIDESVQKMFEQFPPPPKG